jgi:hypothetical protein
MTRTVMHARCDGLYCMLLRYVGGVTGKGRVNGTAHAAGLHYRRLINVAESVDTPSLALRPSYIVKLGLDMRRALSRIIPTLRSPGWRGSPCSMEELSKSTKRSCDKRIARPHTSEKDGSFPGKFCSPG